MCSTLVSSGLKIIVWTNALAYFVCDEENCFITSTPDVDTVETTFPTCRRDVADSRQQRRNPVGDVHQPEQKLVTGHFVNVAFCKMIILLLGHVVIL